MKKRLLAALTAVVLITMLALVGCGETVSAAFDQDPPWRMPTLYEYSEFRVEKYNMKADGENLVKGDLLAEGKAVFILRDTENKDNARLTMTTTITYNDNELNGYDKGLTDTVSSEVVFNKYSYLPVSSKKTAELAMRRTASGAEVQNDSYSLAVDYAAGSAELAFTARQDADKQTKKVSTGSQIFDNEQLFFVMRAFSAMRAGSSQSFRLFNPADAFFYNNGVYTMAMTVDAETTDVILEGFKGDAAALELPMENELPKLPCLNVTLGINSEKKGTPLYATYSTVPFKISNLISTKKVLTGLRTVDYGSDFSSVYHTFYTLTNYAAGENAMAA